MGDLMTWLKRKETIIVIPVFDTLLIMSLRILYVSSYIALRVIFRLILGKERRDKLFTKKGIFFNYEFDIIPAYFEVKLLNRIMKFLNLRDTNLIRIQVPNYNYSAYCPVTKNDLMNMSVREDELIHNFSPNKGETFIDVGAHIGRYTLISSKYVGSDGKVIAIEADPKNFEILNRNLSLNKVTNVISLNAAAYSERRKLRLYSASYKPGYSIYNTVVLERLKPAGFVEVHADTLDRIIESERIKPEEINWIKIDVEGAELEVLKGATIILSKSKNLSILIEIHLLSGGKTLYQSIVDLLSMYKIFVEYEEVHKGGEKHIIARKIST